MLRADSGARWRLDEAALAAGTFLALRGGPSGQFALVTPDGVASVGTYDGARLTAEHSALLGRDAAEALDKLRTSLRARGVTLPAPALGA